MNGRDVAHEALNACIGLGFFIIACAGCWVLGVTILPALFGAMLLAVIAAWAVNIVLIALDILWELVQWIWKGCVWFWKGDAANRKP